MCYLCVFQTQQAQGLAQGCLQHGSLVPLERMIQETMRKANKTKATTFFRT